MTDETVREQFEAIVNEFANLVYSVQSQRIYSRERSKLVDMLMEAKIFEAGRRAGMEEAAESILPTEMFRYLRHDIANRPDLEERWLDLAAIYCPHCKTDGWPNNDEEGTLWHQTPSVKCTASHIWMLRSDTKATQELSVASAIRERLK